MLGADKFVVEKVAEDKLVLRQHQGTTVRNMYGRIIETYFGERFLVREANQ